ncbi:MAG: M48 family metalloprotease [Candidatus Midichloria sp.]|nr:MAG: M48 family metalloprotease [Candidatus Midichloria sp.]
MKLSNYMEIMGVLAHEIAHITLNHPNKRAKEMRDAIKKATVNVSNHVEPRKDCDILSSKKERNVRLSISNIRRSI